MGLTLSMPWGSLQLLYLGDGRDTDGLSSFSLIHGEIGTCNVQFLGFGLSFRLAIVW